jgi:hypothetical protein
MAEQHTAKLAEAIMNYLDCHPNAADSIAGIMQWWLPHDLSSASLDDVQGALDKLIAEHRVTRSLLPGGTELFGRMRSPEATGDADK